MGFCWVSVEFPLGSHWFHLIGFVLGSLSPPGPERVSSGVLFGVTFGFFGFLGGFGWVSLSLRWVSIGFLLSSSWVHVGFILLGLFWGLCLLQVQNV